MSLIYGEPMHDPAKGPQTHVLIIGVGAYRHLEGGPEEKLTISQGLGQLSSPPVSARRLAEWITQTPLRNSEAPLGSVELLLSPSAPIEVKGVAKAVEAATMANIQQAFTAWDQRCDADRGNVAIFYFCGHGLESASLVLLAEDFGHDPVPWHQAIDFHKTYNNMRLNKAFTQIYLIDACREVTTELLKDPDFGGMALRAGSLRAKEDRIGAQIFATSAGRKAFGPDRDVSYFTAALLEALSGKGAEYKGGRWVIKTESLGAKVREILNYHNQTLERQQQQTVNPAGVHADNRTIHMIDQPPLANVIIACQPAIATQMAEFFMQQGPHEFRRPPGATAWAESVPAGFYEVGATFADGAYENLKRPEFITPPVTPILLEVR